MVQTQQQVTAPNQSSGGLIYVNHTPDPIMSIEQLDKYIIYLLQIRKYAVNNNVLRIALKQNKEM